MVNVTEKHLDEINDWRIQLLKEIDQLKLELDTKTKDLEILEIQSNILGHASEKFSISSNEREGFWKTHGEDVENKFSAALDEFDKLRSQNYKKQRELQTIISSIEEFFKRNEYTNY